MTATSHVACVTLTLAATDQPDSFAASWTSADGSCSKSDQPLTVPLAELRGLMAALSDSFSSAPASRDVLLERMKQLGRRLFDEFIRARFYHEYKLAVHHSARFSLRLEVPASLADLPFELMRDHERGLFLGANDASTLARAVPGARRDLPPITYPLRLLLVAAQPRNTPILQIQQEIQQLHNRLKPLQELGLWEIEELVAGGTLESLRALPHVKAQSIHVLHFIGHGLEESGGRQPALAFADAEGRLNLVEADELNAVLARYANLRLVVLNCCHGANASQAHRFPTLAQMIARLEVPAVVAMRQSISDAAAVMFGSELYGRLGRGESVEGAVNYARTSLQFSKLSRISADWSSPQVFHRGNSALLFVGQEQDLPWERQIDEAIQTENLESAFTIAARVAELPELNAWEQARLENQLDVLVQSLIDLGLWERLERLLCEPLGQFVPYAKREEWNRLVQCRRGFQRRCEQLREGLDSSNLLHASQTMADCRQLIAQLMELIRGVPANRRHWSIYGGDPFPWEQFWQPDLRELSRIEQSTDRPVLPPEAVQLLAKLDQIIEQGGVPVACELDDVPPECHESLQSFLFHPLAEPGQLESARRSLVNASSTTTGSNPPSAAQLLRRLIDSAGRDGPLLEWCCGDQSRAISAWEQSLRQAESPRLAHRSCRHLALVELSRCAAGSTPPLLRMSESALAVWAILLTDPEAETEFSGPGLRIADRNLVRRWFVGDLQSMENGFADPQMAPAIHRDLILQDPPAENPVDQPNAALTPRYTDQDLWYQSEVAGIELLRQHAPHSHSLPCLMGYAGIGRFGLQTALANWLCGNDRERSAGSGLREPHGGADWDPTSDTRTVRCLYSCLRPLWQAIQSGWPVNDLVKLLARLPIQTPHGGDEAKITEVFWFLNLIPAPWRPAYRQCSWNEFQAANPVHSRQQDPVASLAEDYGSLVGQITIARLRQDLLRGARDWPLLDEITTLAARMAADGMIAEGDLRVLQHQLADHIEAEVTLTGRASSEMMRMLDLMSRLSDSDEYFRNVMRSCFVLKAQQLVQAGQIDDVVRCLGMLVDRCPEDELARQLFCQTLLELAEAHQVSGNWETARQLAEEVRRVADESPSLAKELLDHRYRALDLLQKIGNDPIAELRAALNLSADFEGRES